MKTLGRNAIRLIIILFILLALGAVAAHIAKAKAQMVSCYPSKLYGEGLKNEYGEEKVAHGQASTGRAVALFLNPDTRTWTIVVMPASRPLACPVLMGEGWETFEPEKESH